ncbi:MAG: hypothetical protein JW682_07265 [Campylobacterales bacterium]|nr:hypothetical protein [Campylobacterales bacterium]HEO99019.1 hypothetical protein [Campylobacterota bacterium]
MHFTFGDYKLRVHSLENKLSVQVTSDLGEVHLVSEDQCTSNFPNEICFAIENPSRQPQAMGLKRFAFGEYTFILGVNYSGELFLFHSVKLFVGKKVIDGKDTLTLAFLKDPKA